MDLKSYRLTGFKAAGDPGAEDLKEGQFRAYASTWTRTPDSYGDVVTKGAFVDTLEAWKASGNALPLLFGHDTVDPFSNIGEVINAIEDDHGLLVTNQLDLENPKASQVYRMLKGRRINQMSFAYDVIDSAIIEENGTQVRDLKKLDLFEISVVPFGANADTEVLAVKALAESAKAGRIISAKNLEQLTAARDALNVVIETAAAESGKSESDHEASSDDTTAKAQERKAAEARQKSALAQFAYTDSL